MAMLPTVLLILTISSVHAYWLDIVELPSSRLYSLDTELCCNGTIYENNNSTDHECCGPKLINTKTEICCYPEVYPRHETTDCCGSQSYSTLTHKCTSVLQYKSKGSWSILLGTLVVLPIDFQGSCGVKEFNYVTEICCKYEVFANPDGKLDCCKSKIYDFSTHICCGDEIIIPKAEPEDNACCGTEPYNQNTHNCAKGVVISKTNDDNWCGSVLFEPSTEICCTRYYSPIFVITKSELDHNDCCGNQSYNTTNFLCCKKLLQNGVTEIKLHSKADIGSKRCCGTELIDYSRDCCHGEPYDTKTHTCCEVFVPDEPYKYIYKIVEGAKAKCCGVNAMDPEKEQCCGTSIIAISPEGKSGCCVHRSLRIHEDANNLSIV